MWLIIAGQLVALVPEWVVPQGSQSRDPSWNTTNAASNLWQVPFVHPRLPKRHGMLLYPKRIVVEVNPKVFFFC